MTGTFSRRRFAIFASLLLVVNFLLYAAGAGGPYLADDVPNLVENRALLMPDWSWKSLRAAAESSPSSQLRRPLSMLSFAANYTLAGNQHAFAVKLTNALLHVLTGLGVLFLALRLARVLGLPGRPPLGDGEARILALLAAGLWLFHPLFVSTVLYAVQRMAVLSALFVIWGCVVYLRLRDHGDTGDPPYGKLALVVCVFTAAACLCKENGALLPGFLLIIEWCRGGLSRGRPPGAWHFLWLTVLTAPTIFVLAYVGWFGIAHWHQSAGGHLYTVGERFLTQFRAMTHYAGWLAMLNPEPLSLYHDDIRASRDLFHPVTTLVCAVGGIAGVLVALRLAGTRSLYAFSILWFLWGHTLESTTLPLALVYEYRNYLPGVGFLLGFSALIWQAISRLVPRPALKWTLVLGVLLVLPGFRLVERVQAWSDERSYTVQSLISQPDSPLGLLQAATFLDARSDYPAALSALQAARALKPADVSFVLAEAAIRCENRPWELFDPDLRRSLGGVQRAAVRTTTARAQFVAMTKACSRSDVNDRALMPLYLGLQHHRDEAVAMYALFGAGSVHLHRGDLRGAERYWSEAFTRYPRAKALRPELDRLRAMQAGRRSP